MHNRGPDDDQPVPASGRLSHGGSVLLGVALLAAAWAAAAQAMPSASLDDLVAKAARQGVLRVIVELRTDSAGPARPEAISHAQDLVLQELTGTSHRVVRRFTSIPFIALEVTADALRRLGGSAHVADIREDSTLRPQGAPATP